MAGDRILKRIESERVRQVLWGATLVALLLGLYVVLRPFLVPVLWAAIVAVASWPAFVRLRSRVGETWAAVGMTLFLVALVIAPILLLVWAVTHEITFLYAGLESWLAGPQPALPSWLAGLPWLGAWLGGMLDRIWSDPGEWQAWLGEEMAGSSRNILSLVGDVGRNILEGIAALFVAFFFFRHGDDLVGQGRRVFNRFIGKPRWLLVHATAETIRAVVYGLLLTAVAQGTLAGIGYWAVGVPAPALLGAATVLLALIPFGAPFVWLPVSALLIAQGSTWPGIGLLIWGVTAVSTIDNLLRPLVISRVTRIPFLLVFFGVVGGVAAFGLLGLFIGPLLLSVALTLWREWSQEAEAAEKKV